jgi:hypothetical protein
MEYYLRHTLIITNQLGQVVYNNTFEQGEHTLNLEKFKSGIYFVRSTTGTATRTTKLIKID